ncbi:MAG TPA: hypothetical protein VF188_02650 [Longimicrobiales bacterium]
MLIPLIVLFLGVGSAWLSGCSASDEMPSAERYIDDGLEVVVSHAPAWRVEDSWRLSDTPTLQIGHDESLGEDYIFSGISGATRTPDGRIVVADRRAAELRFYDSEGVLLHVAGGRGKGPGEFSWIFNLLRCDENALHAVGADASVSVFDFNGRFERRFYPGELAGFLIRYAFVCDRDGRFVVTEQTLEHVGAEGVYRSTANMFLLDSGGGGRVIADLGSFPIQERLAGAGGSSSHPLGKQTSVAIFDGQVYVGTADIYEIMVFNNTSRPVRRIRRDIQPERLDEGMVKRYLATWAETLPADDRELMLRRFSGADYPDAYPAYARLLVDALGYLWVEAFRRDFRSPRTWSVFDPEGIWLGDLEMPSRFHALEIGDDYVLGRFTGELGQESVRLYALER